MNDSPNRLTTYEWAEAFCVQPTKVSQVREPWLEKLDRLARFAILSDRPTLLLELVMRSIDRANSELNSESLSKLESMNTGRLDRSSLGHGST